MAENIKTITDRGQFENIFYKYFMTNDVFFKTKSGNIKIKFLGYTEGLVAFKIPYLKNIAENALVFTMQKEHILYAHLKFAEKQEEDLYLFYPVKIQLIFSYRKEGRKSMTLEQTGQGKKVIYVHNVISDFIIENCIAMSLKKVDRIKETIRFDVERLYEHIKIFFINEGVSDPRMKYFLENTSPIFIANRNEKPDEKNIKQFNFYLNEIYTKDYYLINRKNLISEISVPILFRTKIPYGYIQVNNSTPISPSAQSVVKRMAVITEELFSKNKIFPQGNERLLVSDISKRGLGIVFNERKYIRYFKERSIVLFDLTLPGNKKATILSIVRNITLLENKIIKIGCEIKDLDALSEVNYDEFLESVGLPTD